MAFHSRSPLKHTTQNPYDTVVSHQPQPPPPQQPLSGSYGGEAYFYHKRKRDDNQDYYPHYGYPDSEHRYREQRASTPPLPPPLLSPLPEASNRHYSPQNQQWNDHHQQNFSAKRPRSSNPDNNNKFYNRQKYQNRGKYYSKGRNKHNPTFHQPKLSFKKCSRKHGTTKNANLQPQQPSMDNHDNLSNSPHYQNRHHPAAPIITPSMPIDTLEDEAARQRLICCFDDTVFISTADLEDHYQTKYGRGIVLNRGIVQTELPLLIPNIEFASITGDSRMFLRRAYPSLMSHLSMRWPMNSLRIMRNRLARLCSSVVTKLVVKDMYIQVYGRNPDFPLIVDDEDVDGSEREEGQLYDGKNQYQKQPKQTVNDWDELLKLVPLDRKYLEVVRAPALWDNEDDPTAKPMPLIVKVEDLERPLHRPTSSDREEDDKSVSSPQSSRHYSVTLLETPAKETDAVRDQQNIPQEDIGSSGQGPLPPLLSDTSPTIVSPSAPALPPTSPSPPNRMILQPSPATLKPLTVVSEATFSAQLNNLLETNASTTAPATALSPSNKYKNEREPGELEESEELEDPGKPRDLGKRRAQRGSRGLKKPKGLRMLVKSPELEPIPKSVSDLHAIGTMLMKLFEDVIYVPMLSLQWHFERKYGHGLDVPRKLTHWVKINFPTTLIMVRFLDLDSTTTFLTLAHRPPMRLISPSAQTSMDPNPSVLPAPIPYAVLRVRLARLCFTHHANPELFYRMYTSVYGPLSSQQFPMTIRPRRSFASPVSHNSSRHQVSVTSWEDLLRIVRAEIGARGSGWWGASNVRVKPLYGDEKKIVEAEEKGDASLSGEIKLVHPCKKRSVFRPQWFEFVGSDGWRVDSGGSTETKNKDVVDMKVGKDDEEKAVTERFMCFSITGPDAPSVAGKEVEGRTRMEFEQARDEPRTRVPEVEQARNEHMVRETEFERARDEFRANIPPQPPAVPRVQTLTDRQTIMLQLLFQVNKVLPYPKRKLMDL